MYNKLPAENVLAVYFSALRWQRSQQWTKDECYCHVVECPRTEEKPPAADKTVAEKSRLFQFIVGVLTAAASAGR